MPPERYDQYTDPALAPIRVSTV